MYVRTYIERTENLLLPQKSDSEWLFHAAWILLLPLCVVCNVYCIIIFRMYVHTILRTYILGEGPRGQLFIRPYFFKSMILFR